MSTERTVVVTGLGCVTPLGLDLPTTWDGLLAGRSGVKPITRFDPNRLPVRIAGQVDGFDPTRVVDRKLARHMDRFQQLAVAAAFEAVERAGVTVTPANAERVGVIVGSGIGGLGSMEEGFRALFARGPRAVSPFLIPRFCVDLAAGHISILLGARGPNYATVSACATSAHAIGEAAWHIRAGRADVMLAGGSEAGLVELGMASFCTMHALSRRNDDPAGASRPFDAGRDGFVFAEGAAVLVLEERSHAEARGAPILAEIAGYGMSADAHHITEPAPQGAGAAEAMRLALGEAGMEPGEIGYINAHATSTVVGDVREVEAIHAVFGDEPPPVSSTKSMTGHMLGAAGAMETLVCVQALATGMLPPTINQETPDPACDLDVIPNVARPAPIAAAMNNAYGFGGHNACLVLRRPSTGTAARFVSS